MVHACVCCPLRFRTNGELADHVRTEHSEAPHFERTTLSVVRPHFPAPPPREPRSARKVGVRADRAGGAHDSARHEG